MKNLLLLCTLFLSFTTLYADTKTTLQNTETVSTLATRLHVLRAEGLNALDIRNYKLAEQIFKEILSLEPEKWLEENEYNEILIYLTKAEIQTKQLAEAEKHLSKLLEEGLTPTQLYSKESLKAQISFAKGDTLSTIVALHVLMEHFDIQEWNLSDQRFYVKVKNQVDQYYEDLFTQAERCFEGGIYQETVPIYQEILSALNTGAYRQDKNAHLPIQVRLRMAYCEFQQGNHEKSKELLIDSKQKFAPLFDSDSFYQLIVSCRELKKYDEALQYCQEFFTFKFGASKQELIRFEVARIYYLKDERVKAKKMLENLLKELKDPHCLALSRFYLAKVLIQEKQYTEVEVILSPDHFQFKADDMLKYEWAYLRAEALYHRKQYEMAVAGFKESLAHPGIKKANWYQDTLYNLGFAYLKLGEDRLMQEKSKEEFFKLGEATFEELIKAEDSDRAKLALARAYLMQYYYLKDSMASENVHELFKGHSFQSLESKLEAGFILADMTADLENRGKIYTSLCSSIYEEAENYGKAWYYRGIFYSQLSALNQDQKSLEQAIESFKESFVYLKKHYPHLAITSIKNMIGASLNSESTEALSECFLYLENFLQVEIPSISVKNAAIDLGCLKAEVCLKLVLQGDSSYFTKGIEAVNHLPSLNGETPDRAKFLKARLYFQNEDYTKSKETLLHLIETAVSSDYLGDSWFWMAECQELEGVDKSQAKEYRKKVFDDYPNCKLAPEAYFLYYSFSEYLDGHSDAINHLVKMKESFEHSPYLITSYYLLGLNKKQEKKDIDGRVLETKDLSAAAALLTQAKENFITLFNADQIPKSNELYFVSVYYRSILASAQVYLEKADESIGAKRHIYLEKAIESFNEVVSDFSEEGHRLASLLYRNQNNPKIFEEASFGQALALAKDGQIPKAEEALSAIVDCYSRLEIETGHYLSRAWYELAMIAMAKQEYQDALDYYVHAENSIDGQTHNGSQKIDLGIQQSLCYRFLGQLDMAMLTLSKVINEGVISNLRVKAMVLRAEIYEMQDRKELAQKQLEAASKKGGEWGSLAREKLVKEYGVN